jgi:site-specific recombinase XerD
MVGPDGPAGTPPPPGEDGERVYPERPSLTRDEVEALRRAPTLPEEPTDFEELMHWRDRVFLGLLDDTMARVGELVEADVADLYDLESDEPLLWIENPKVKVVWRPARDVDAIPEGAPMHYRTRRLDDGRKVEVPWYGERKEEKRWAPVTDRTREALLAYREARDDWTDDAPLLVSKFGRLSEEGGRYIVDEYAKQVGIQARYEAESGDGQTRRAVTPHAIREAAERELLHEKEDTKLLAEVAGHSVEVQQEFYNRSNRADVKALARRKEKIRRRDEQSSPDLDR